MEENSLPKKRVVVIGGGFAGLNFITHLSKNDHYAIMLVDKNNYNYFTPFIRWRPVFSSRPVSAIPFANCSGTKRSDSVWQQLNELMQQQTPFI
jgi:NADH dehydrogenase FAD-containing subunit